MLDLTYSKKPMLFSLWGLRKGFSVITPQTWTDYLEYNCGATVRTRIKNLGKLPQGFHQLAPERCFVFFLSPIQHGLSYTYSALISTMFETTEVNRCAGTYTHEKFPNFFVGVLQAPKTAPSGVHVTSIQLKQHNIFGWQESFRGLVDIPRMCLVCVSFDGGCTVWVLWPPEDVHFIVNTSLISGCVKVEDW